MSIEELVAAIQAGDDSKLGELWDKISGLVKWKAKRTMTALESLNGAWRVEFDDLYQSGYLAMLSALETYKPESGAFSSWLMYYLRTAFAETAGYRTKQGRLENAAVSLDEPLDDEEQKSRRVDFLADDTAQDAMESIEDREYQKQLHEALEAAIDELPKKQGSVLRLRYFQGQALREAGESMSVSMERVRQLERNGIQLLKEPEHASKLFPFWEFDCYLSTGLQAFRNKGMSVQECYLIVMENRRERAVQEARRGNVRQSFGH